MTLTKAQFTVDDIYQAIQTGVPLGTINTTGVHLKEDTVPYVNKFTTQPPPTPPVKQSKLSLVPTYRYETFVFVSKSPEESLIHWDESSHMSLEACIERLDSIKKAYEVEVEAGKFFAYKVVAYKLHIHLGTMEFLASYEKVGKVKEKVYLNGPKKAKSKAALTNHLNKTQGTYNYANN